MMKKKRQSTVEMTWRLIKWQKSKTDEGTLYTYVSKDTRTCLIKNDKSVEIRANGLLSNYPSEAEIAKMKDIKELLDKIQKAHFCVGTEEGYDCPNILFPVSGRINGLCVRCPHCRVFRAKYRGAINSRKRRMDLKDVEEKEKICVVKGCPGRNSRKIHSFPIPLDDIEAWCANLKLDVAAVNEDTRVCSRHFEDSCKYPLTLKIGARPTLNLGHNDDIPYPITKLYRKIYHRCCIVGCNAAYPPHKLYRFPAEGERLKQWLLICVIKDDMIGSNAKYICTKHFDASMFRKNGLKHNAIPKMDARSWLENNANVDVLETMPLAENNFAPAEKQLKLEPEVAALCEIQNALTSKAEVCQAEDANGSDSDDDQDGLECKSVCLTCAKAFKDCETYRQGCYDLEKQLEILQAKTEELKIQNEILMTELDSNIIVYQEDQ